MHAPADKQLNSGNSEDKRHAKKERPEGPALQFQDNRIEGIVQSKMQDAANSSFQTSNLAHFSEMAGEHASRQTLPVQKKENNTGLPDDLKSGVENLSGYSMNDVKVHYNSAGPAQLHAHAYAQGTEIHVAPGQEKHLAHEAWHVVQQKQGRVFPTVQMKGEVQLNDDAGLEQEADIMGEKASGYATSHEPRTNASLDSFINNNNSLVQLKRVSPVLTDASVLNGDMECVMNTDTVADGPASLWEFDVRIKKRLVNRDAAMAAIRTEYTSIGKGFGTNKFISKQNVEVICAQAPKNMNAVFSNFQNVGYVPQHVDLSKIDFEKKKKWIYPLLNSREILDTLLNKENIATLVDPIRVVVHSKYKGGSLTVAIEYTEGQKGYISRVEDTADSISAGIADRPNYEGEFPVPGKDVEKQTIKNEGTVAGALEGYSNVHHTATNEDVGTQIGRMGPGNTKAHREAGVDAITKVIAEGGRWNAVAAMGNALKNNSLFFTQLQSGKYRTVELRELWKKWTAKFKGAYGIPDNEIVTQITKAQKDSWVKEVDNQPAANNHNYDLDNSRVH